MSPKLLITDGLQLLTDITQITQNPSQAVRPAILSNVLTLNPAVIPSKEGIQVTLSAISSKQFMDPRFHGEDKRVATLSGYIRRL